MKYDKRRKSLKCGHFTISIDRNFFTESNGVIFIYIACTKPKILYEPAKYQGPVVQSWVSLTLG